VPVARLLLLKVLVDLCQEVLDEQGDVFPPVPQWRQLDVDDGQPVVPAIF
jgi:hypothetical protein